MKRCYACQQYLTVDRFGPCRSRPDGLQASCKGCRLRYTRTHKERDRAREYARQRAVLKGARDQPKGSRRDPVKLAARYRLRYEVRCGRIVKPSACSSCGTDGAVHGHHEDYGRPLDVEWLCRTCHGVRHRLLVEEA